MKVISLSVSERDYDAYKHAAAQRGRSVAQLIREAMAYYRAAQLERRLPLRELPVLAGHKPVASLPSRSEIYDEVFVRERDDES